jgi:hypothetical protein
VLPRVVTNRITRPKRTGKARRRKKRVLSMCRTDNRGDQEIVRRLANLTRGCVGLRTGRRGEGGIFFGESQNVKTGSCLWCPIKPVRQNLPNNCQRINLQKPEISLPVASCPYQDVDGSDRVFAAMKGVRGPASRCPSPKLTSKAVFRIIR